MNRALIFWPVLAQVLLTGIVWVRMLLVRVAEMRARRISPQSIATSREIANKLENVAPADNFRNLFEVPVLFFAACAALASLDLVTPVQLGLAWAFVGLRYAHSFIQLTSNRVMHRFRVYVLSTLCVFGMWAVFAFQIGRA
jgi:hypothetical protein